MRNAVLAMILATALVTGELHAIAVVVDPAGHPIGLYSRTPIQ